MAENNYVDMINAYGLPETIAGGSEQVYPEFMSYTDVTPAAYLSESRSEAVPSTEVVDKEEEFFTPKVQKILPWAEVVDTDKYKALPTGKQAEAAMEYFETQIASKVPDEDYDEARKEFLNYNSKLNNEKVPGLLGDIARTAGSTILKAPARAVGMALGALNSPLAFLWGSMEASEIDPEEFKKKNFVEQSLIRLGAGFDSAWRSATKEGDWGTMYGEYYKAVTGRTIKEDLESTYEKAGVPDPKLLAEQTAPTVEVIANVVTDPLIIGGLSKQAAKEAATAFSKVEYLKAFFGNDYDEMTKLGKEMLTAETNKELINLSARISKSPSANDILKDLRELDKEELKDQIVETEKLLRKAIEKRKEYEQWWKDANLPPGMEKFNMAKKLDVQNIEKSIQDLERQLVSQYKDWDKMGLNLSLSPEQIKLIEEIDKNYVSVGKEIPEELKNQLNGFLKPAIEEALLGFKPTIAEKAEVFQQPLVKSAVASEVGIQAEKQSKGAAAEATRFIPVEIPAEYSKYPSASKVHQMVGKEDNATNMHDFFSKANTALFDRFSPIKESSPEAYVEARRYQSYKDIARLKFEELTDRLAPVRDQGALVSDYFLAHRAKVRAERGITNPNNVTLKDADQAIKEIETIWKSKGKDVKQLNQALKDWQQWNNNTLKELYESGFISKEAYNDIAKNNRWYVTFDVLEKMPNLDDMPMLRSKEWFSVANQDVIKSMTGTEKLIKDPIESTIRNFTKAQEVIARNKVARTLIDDPNMKELARPVAESELEFAAMQKKGLNPVMAGDWDKTTLDTINVFRDGKVEKYVVDANLAEAMKQLAPWQAPRFLQAYNKIFRGALTTYNPAFWISNATRDALLAYTSSPVYKAHDILGKFEKDWLKGAHEALKFKLGKESLQTDFIKHGGSFGFLGSEAFEKGASAQARLFAREGLTGTMDRAKNAGLKIVDSLAAIGEIIEMAPRLGVYDRALKLGYSADDAAMLARQATIDFNRGGTWTKVVNQFVPFLNARVQAKVTLAEAFKNDPKNTAAKLFTTVTLPGTGLYAYNRLYWDKEYDQIPDWIKKDNFVFITGTKKNEKGKEVPEYFVIPKGDVGSVGWNWIEFGLDQMWKDDKKGAQKLLISFLSDMSPVPFERKGELSPSQLIGSLTPPIIKGAVEDWANLRLYQGTPIVPRSLERKPPELQFKEETPEVYKELGKILKVSPLRLQNYASNIVGSYGREGFSPSNMLDGMKKRIIRSDVGALEDQAWTSIKGIEQGYMTSRAYAEEAIKEGDPSTAIRIMNEWNSKVLGLRDDYNKDFGDTYLIDKGGIMNSYFFTPQKRRNILKKKAPTLEPLERKLRK